MKRSIIAVLTAGLLTVSAHAGDLWKVENCSYVSTDLRSLITLFNTQHGTNRYRAIRDLLIDQGTLFPCSPGEVVEAISYRGGIATIVTGDGTVAYIPQEDFVRYLGNRAKLGME
jgi:hypothetical protein